MNFYAHTGISKYERQPQLYVDHIGNMYRQAIKDCQFLSLFLQKAVLTAVLLHDLGKLEASSQLILSQPDMVDGAHLLNHVDAGVAFCIRKYNETKDISFIYSAYFIHAHHIGIQDRDDLFKLNTHFIKGQTVVINDLFRDKNFSSIVNECVATYTDKMLDEWYSIHNSLFNDEMQYVYSLTYDLSSVTPIEIRFAVSVLVDCDHTDTTNHYYGKQWFKHYELRPAERLDALQSYVNKLKETALSNGIASDVVESRNVLFNICSQIDVTNYRMYACAAPTGKGKTVSLLNLGLRIAKQKNRKSIFFIIPFTNIISQSVQVYRKSIVLDDEIDNRIVTEIHSKVEFGTDYRRMIYTHLWNAPINVSTSVQFFSSLFSNHPSAIRKLKQMHDGVIIFDEYHTSLPPHLWDLVLLVLDDISKKYNIDFIFGSGSPVHFWDKMPNINVVNVVPDDKYEEFSKFENNRINFESLGTIASERSLYRTIKEKVSHNDTLIMNTLVVCKTVMNAVLVTKHFKENTNWKVFHLSSYITPVDREKILESIHIALKGNEKIILIASSIIECGIDFSFDIGFKEKTSLMSIIQFGGRINRNSEKNKANIYEFSFDKTFIKNSDFTTNPEMEPCINARNGLEVNMENCTQAIENERSIRGGNTLVKEELQYKFKYVNDNFTVIENLSDTVIINKEIIQKIKQNEPVDPVEINRNSISIFRDKLNPAKKNNWCQYVEVIKGSESSDDVTVWVGPYDSTCYGAYAFIV